MADDFVNLNPRTDREWMQLIVHKIDEISKYREEDNEDILTYMNKIDAWIDCHDRDLQNNLSKLTKHEEKIDQLEKKVNAWSLTNTIAAIGAFITALFMKGS